MQPDAIERARHITQSHASGRVIHRKDCCLSQELVAYILELEAENTMLRAVMAGFTDLWANARSLRAAGASDEAVLRVLSQGFGSVLP